MSSAGKVFVVFGLLLGLASLAVHNNRGIIAGVAVAFVGILMLTDFHGT
jgi:hypothetical protein